MTATITREKLKAKIDRGEKFQLVETLPETAFRGTHLPGAIHLPPDRVHELAPQVLPGKKAEIVLYCASPT
jgi:rhodanese-related sulfurtransferase